MHLTTVGQRIKYSREQGGMTQEGLGIAVGVDRSHVSRWERDEVIPRGSTRLKIANALGISTEWLRTGEGTQEVTLTGPPGMEVDRGADGERLEALHQIIRTIEKATNLLDEGVAKGESAAGTVWRSEHRDEVIRLMDVGIRQILELQGWEIPSGISATAIIELSARVRSLGAESLPLEKMRRVVLALVQEEGRSGQAPSDALIRSMLDLAR